MIRIVADNTCDLLQDIIEHHNIAVIPKLINVGNKGYRDSVDITPVIEAHIGSGAVGFATVSAE